ncbi:hypothetical protein [Curtobacterium sp. MCJR17_043]|uniref:hypothetical protein n=1 Tax=Curtobacterium sp. MCJR17_043 TaxID=2175660 RepID=UPI0024DF96EC|nr:hypothetical protein [Curtobacterium sp. MCJR17_043]WIB35204.1 hypothetical protein DEJ15_12615 [Curtobacterium sp. MCJR17_043]
MSSSVNSPYALRVRDLAHRPGDMREVSLDITVPSTLGAGLIAVREGDQMHLDVKLEGLHEGVLASGTARAEATGGVLALSHRRQRARRGRIRGTVRV